MLTAQKDHPRIRGEHRGGASGTDDIPGSSPHTRGAHSGWPEGSRTPGIIPAYAGSTERGHGDVNRAWDHPRIRGEHGIPKIRATLIVGSSPHTRGAQPSRSRLWTWSRIIPAYAGSTRLPRSMATSRTGSSPHTRGALGSGSVVDPRMRIIPAYAGSTRAGACGPSAPTDHPRIRGEHPHDPLRGRLSAGIIPAYAGSTSAGRRASRSRSDHPRIRGEHARPSTGRVDDVGSSPHTRGALCCHDRRPRRAVDHPRIRGEHQIHLNSTGDIRGSSPHTRGARPMARRRLRHRGIIPAYAGSTASARRRGRTVGDHPRIRGEHPRGEGRRNEGGRIIPAYAGSTASFPRQAPRPPDHPRIRGEHRPSSPGSSWTAGSSPHTRGAPDRGEARQSGDGIIPAYAGSTASSSPPCPPPSDHPRIRGEHTRVPETETRSPGSSPHTRGALEQRRRPPCGAGIIPAYAGSTPTCPKSSRKGTDHPRIRGEHMGTQSCELTCLGSSPHTRGAHGTATPPQRLSGIIPAYAGSTRRETAIYTIGLGSSPHTRGAPRRRRRHEDRRRIIPAYAGSTRP